MAAELQATHSFAVRVVLAVAIVAGFAAAWWAADVLLLVFGGTLFGIMPHAAADWVASRDPRHHC